MRQNRTDPAHAYSRMLLRFAACFALVFVCSMLLATAPPHAFGVQEEPPGAEAHVAQWPPLQTRPMEPRYVLVLDAGHGGHDPGAVGALGETESDINQQMVERVTALLKAHEAEILVRQAHTPGTYATPMARTNTAVQLRADLLVSLHLNGDDHADVRGFMCLPAPPGRVHHDDSMRFARLLAAEVQSTPVPVLGTEGIYYTYYIKTPSGYARETLDAVAPGAATPRRDDSYGVVEYPGCPAVLAELWHISSPEDMALCNNDAGMERMARCVYRAVCAFFGLQPLK